MTRRVCLIVAILGLLSSFLTAQSRSSSGPIVVSPNHRFLQYEDGTPFFWQGDTAWLLFSKLDRPATERYLDDRQQKGFNVIQVMVLHEPSMKNAYGIPALVDGDPARPHVNAENHTEGPDYWTHLDWVLDQAAKRGIYVALVPAWGSLVKSGALNQHNAEDYATFLANRYRAKPNVFWVLGGDIQGDREIEVWRIMGQTLRRLDLNHLITFHPFGRTQSSTWFHNEPWLDFNMFQSGHRRYDQDTNSPHRYGEDNWRYAAADYALKPIKPVLDAEPSYEGIPQGLHDPKQPYWQAADARRYAYWSVFAGSFGHTYGHNAVMQFHSPAATGEAFADGSYGVKDFWYDAIDAPGAGQMRYLKALLLSRPYFERAPDQSVLVGAPGDKYDYIAVTRGNSYLFAYTYTAKPIQLRLGVLTGRTLNACWYSPRDGSAKSIGTVPNKGTRTFTPPGPTGPGNDWVLVLDDKTKGFARPGNLADSR